MYDDVKSLLIRCLKWGQKQQLTHSSEDEDEDECTGHQASVPGPLGLVNCWDPEEDEDDGLSNAG